MLLKLKFNTFNFTFKMIKEITRKTANKKVDLFGLYSSHKIHIHFYKINKWIVLGQINIRIMSNLHVF